MAATCCAQIAGVLGGGVYSVGTALYNATQASYWSTQEASLSPACVFLPQTSTEVAIFISTISNITNCNFAVKTQGHAPAAGFANIDGGVTLDLSWLNETVISDDLSTASVGPGSAWVDVYTTLNPYNKTVAGGRNGAVGVGGLTLGGGISYYSPQVGWTCDTVVNFEIVLASGDIVNANATSNCELYRALKGGGNNFGVVTKIDFTTVEAVPLRAGHLFQSQDYAVQVLDAFAGIASAEDYDVHASIVASFSFNKTTSVWTIVSVPIYTLPETDPDVYHELFAIPNITELTTVSIENISTLAAEAPYPQKYEAFYTSTYAASSNLLVALFNVANKTLQSTPYPIDISVSLTFEPLPTVMTQHGEGTNSLGTSKSDGNGVILLVSISWINSDSTAAAEQFGLMLLGELDEAARGLGGLHDFKYMNYADPRQDPLSTYGEANLDFLRSISVQYDPEGIFQTRVPGGFKLWV
ncbi:putative FAD-binding PCMH-type domain-containing protein [Seiridium cardinale]